LASACASVIGPSLNITTDTLMFMHGAGPIGYPGAAEVVNMRPPAHLICEGVHALPCIGNGRQSGTSASPSILNASPEAAANGGLALLRTGDHVQIDLGRGTADVLLPEAELAEPARRAAGRGRLFLPCLADAVAGSAARGGRAARHRRDHRGC
jgi:dihydroxy-acid dehydratase